MGDTSGDDLVNAYYFASAVCLVLIAILAWLPIERQTRFYAVLFAGTFGIIIMRYIVK